MRKIVFVLEDDESLRDIFTLLLEEENLEVKTYPTIAAFHAGLEDAVPDIVVLDVSLPDGNGLDVCAGLKNAIATKSIPVLMVSAHQDFKNTHPDPGAQEYISKPFNIIEFVDTVLKYA